jgi:ketosteroid isomerase-like protein
MTARILLILEKTRGHSLRLRAIELALRRPRLQFFLVTLLLAACTSTTNDQRIEQEIRPVMDAQQAAWNRGDIEGFMEGYDRSDTTTFVSGDQLITGWQTVLDRYKKQYSSREQMGMLTFDELTIKPMGPGLALADGRWHLTRAKDAPHGRFTLLFQRIDNKWRIIHDTTTSATP